MTMSKKCCVYYPGLHQYSLVVTEVFLGNFCPQLSKFLDYAKPIYMEFCFTVPSRFVSQSHLVL